MFLQVVLLSYLLKLGVSAPAPTHLLVTRVGPCDDTQTLIQVSEFSITATSYDYLLGGSFNITTDIENGWKIKATMQKCVDIRNMDTCDFFKSFMVVTRGCEEEGVEYETYAMMFHYSYPEIKCPIKPGTFIITNYPFFTEENYLTVYESKISTSMFGYTFRLEGITVNNETMFCVDTYLQLLYMREHEWTKYTNNTTSAPEGHGGQGN